TIMPVHPITDLLPRAPAILAERGSRTRPPAFVYPVPVGGVEGQRVTVTDRAVDVVGPGQALVEGRDRRARFDSCDDHIGVGWRERQPLDIRCAGWLGGRVPQPSRSDLAER